MQSTGYRMDDFTFGRPAKRKRFTIGSVEESSQASVIDEPRIAQSQALKLNKPIEILVGPPEDKTSFCVHEGLICDRSEFFRNAMKPEWASARPDPRIIELPEDDAAAFGLYMQWIYSRKLPVLNETEDPAIGDEAYTTLAYSYVLGERLMDTEFKNAVMDAFILYARGEPPTRRYYPNNEHIRVLYEGTRESSPMRRLLVDIWTWRGKEDWITADTDLPKDFLVAVTTALLRVRATVENQSRPWKRNHQQYYD